MEEQTNISEIIDNTPESYNFDFQRYFSRGFEICNSYLIGFIGYALLYNIVLEIIGRVPILSYISQILLNPILVVGIYIVAQKISKTKEYSFDDFWKSFKYWDQLIIISLIQTFALLLFLSPIYFAIEINEHLTWYENFQIDPEEIENIPYTPMWLFLLIIPIIYFSVSWVYAPLLVLFHGLTAWEAMKVSLKIVNKKWWVIAFFTFITILLIGIGVLFFGVGLFYTLPLSMCVFYASFEDIMQFYLKEEDEDDILNHLIEKGF